MLTKRGQEQSSDRTKPEAGRQAPQRPQLVSLQTLLLPVQLPI